VPDTLFANVSATGQSMILRAQALMPQMAPMINLVSKQSIGKGKTQADLPYVTSMATVQTPTEGDEVVFSDTFTISSISITPGIKAIKFRISKRAERFSQEQLVALVGDEIGRAEGQNVDELLLNQFTNFHTDNDTGTTNVRMTFATLRAANRKVIGTSVPNGGPPTGQKRSVVMSPIGYEDLLTNLGAQGAVNNANPWIPQGPSMDIMRTYAIPGGDLLGGVGIYWDGYLQGNLVNGAGDTLAGLFAEKALWYVYSQEWEQDTFKESEWIGVILRADADYGVGVGPVNHWGAQITEDDA